MGWVLNSTPKDRNILQKICAKQEKIFYSVFFKWNMMTSAYEEIAGKIEEKYENSPLFRQYFQFSLAFTRAQ